MSKIEEIIDEKTEEKAEEKTEEINPYVVKFDKAYTFERKEYSEIDLSNIENLNGFSLLEADKMFIAKGFVDVLKEINIGYCLIIAHIVSDKPFEFFAGLRANETIKIKNLVSGFLFQ